MIGLIVVLLVGGAKAKVPPKPKPAPAVEVVDAGPPANPWEFDDLPALVDASAQPADDLSTLALTQVQVPLSGRVQLKVSAHANTVGGVTLTFADPNDARTTCALYATREGEGLVFKDSRCSFFVLEGQFRTQAVCRKIEGTAMRAKDAILLGGSSPDCNAAPMGVPLSVRAAVKPVIR